MNILNGYIVKWYYNEEEDGSVKTTCTVEKDGVLLSGDSICSPKDNFSKAMGRKISLKRAVLKLENREERRGIWKAYRNNMTAVPRW